MQYCQTWVTKKNEKYIPIISHSLKCIVKDNFQKKKKILFMEIKI